MAKALPGQTLPSREQGQFRSIVKFYETKQYKKGVKTADGILKKFPEHGETLSMKGLVLNCMGEERKPEAYELVKLGLRHNMRSHVCWHVFGLLYRSDRNYGQAIKCYRNALRIDTENQQILRDLSSLQVQMRDDQGFKETRRMLLTLKPNSKNNWIAFAISQHLLGKLSDASVSAVAAVTHNRRKSGREQAPDPAPGRARAGLGGVDGTQRACRLRGGAQQVGQGGCGHEEEKQERKGEAEGRQG